MSMHSARARVLIIGADYPTFQVYWRYYVNVTEMEVVGFIYCGDGNQPVTKFKGASRLPITVYPLSRIEETIARLRVQKCFVQAQNLSMRRMQSIINRILATGISTVEFLPQNQLAVKAFKPVLIITSIARQVGKTQLGRYCTALLQRNQRKVAVIIPIFDVSPSDGVFDVEDGPHYELSANDEIPESELSQDTAWEVKMYLESGASRVFVTSDIRRAIIRAEQLTDIIIYDAKQCEIPLIQSDYRICVISKKTLNNLREMCLWPGLVNLHMDEIIAVIKQGQQKMSDNTKHSLQRMLKGHKMFFLNSQPVLQGTSGLEVFNRKVMTVGHDGATSAAQDIAKQLGASEVIDPSPFLSEGLSAESGVLVAELPHASSPTPETNAETDQTMVKIADAVNRSDADVIIVSLPKDIPGIDPCKSVLYTTSEINDNNQALRSWLSQFFTTSHKPPLQAHFEAQVDILMAMAGAADRELYVTNNTSSNREAFCRLFLSSHLPPGYRVTTGEVIDASGNTTGQLDVVIVNDSAPMLTVDQSGSVIAPILADSVLSVVEVKTSLTSDSLKKALSQLRPVKALMPTHGTLQSPDGQVIEDRLGGKIITGVFAFNPVADIDKKVYDILKLYPNVADFVVLPDAFAYFSVETLRVCGLSVREEDIVHGYVRYTAKGMGLALIFGLLNSIAAIRRFSGSNCVRYLSGSWGGTQEAVTKMKRDAQHQLHRIDKIIATNASQVKRNEFFLVRSKLALILDEFCDEFCQSQAT